MNDILVGMLLGVLLVVGFNPYKGIFWILRAYRQQIAFLTSGHQVKTQDETITEHGPGPLGSKEKET